MRFVLLTVVATLLVGAEIFWTGAATRAWDRRHDALHNPRRQLEQRIADADLVLHRLLLSEPGSDHGSKLRLRRHELASGTLLLRDETDSHHYLYVDADGYLHRDGAVTLQTSRTLDLYANAEELVVMCDDAVAARLDARSWQAYVVGQRDQPIPKVYSPPKVSIRDGFMRELFVDDNWQVHAGSWSLRKRGGGLATDDREAESYNFQRAVNPFSLFAEKSPHALFGSKPMPNGAIAASFYFGVPKTGKVVDGQTVPIDTSMLLTAGSPAGLQYAFGWHGPRAAFCILQRQSDEPWQLTKVCQASRPPITNWFRLELQLHNASTLKGLLDGQELFSMPLEKAIDGVFGIAGGDKLIEADDVTLDSLPRPTTKPGTPIFVQSRNFSEKRIKKGRDPVQFQQWARGSNTYLRTLRKVDDERILRGITTRIPIYGDLFYQSLPEHPEAGAMPNGKWQFQIMPVANEDAATVIEAERDDRGWRVSNLPDNAWPPDHREFTLRFSRSAANGQRAAVEINGKPHLLGPPLGGPVRVAINRWYKPGERLDPPAPDLHDLRDTNLVHEFFEEAATAWNWTEGSFRMAARWACQAEWNFMACASPGTPFMTSKTAFHGDQEHDYHMTIRPCQPWDAGDKNWTYSRPQFDRNKGWYNRHNLNFSFCADPREPLSGYSLVFAGHDNQQTLLLRQGQVIAATADKDFLMPTRGGLTSVHWMWWHFHVRKRGDRIIIDCNDKTMFDVVDPEPLTGGHVGFWTVRNGFVVSRISSAAESLDRDADARYVPSQTSPTFWRPVIRDTIAIQDGDGPDSQRFTMLTGAGSQAVRHVFTEPVDLATTPEMHLQLTTSASAKVNLHLQIDGRPWLIRVNGPLTEIKRLLIPAGETDTEQFRLESMTKSQVQKHLLASVPPGDVSLNLKELLVGAGYTGPSRLEAITIGNSSNENYLLAGGGGNHAGDWYQASPVSFAAPAGAITQK